MLVWKFFMVIDDSFCGLNVMCLVPKLVFGVYLDISFGHLLYWQFMILATIFRK